MTDQDNLRDAEALGEARRRDKADSDWHAREARLLFIDAARWQRDQLRTDEAIARLANCLHRLDHGDTLDHHDGVCERDRGGCDRRELYTDDARAAITALLGEDT